MIRVVLYRSFQITCVNRLLVQGLESPQLSVEFPLFELWNFVWNFNGSSIESSTVLSLLKFHRLVSGFLDSTEHFLYPLGYSWAKKSKCKGFLPD